MRGQGTLLAAVGLTAFIAICVAKFGVSDGQTSTPSSADMHDASISQNTFADALRSLHEPVRSGLNVSHAVDFLDPRGRRLSVQYDVLERAPVVELASLGPQRYALDGGLLTVRFAPPERARAEAALQRGVVVAFDLNGADLVRTVVAIDVRADGSVVLETRPVELGDLFERGELQLKVRFAGQDLEHKGTRRLAPTKRTVPPRRLGFGSFITQGWNSVKNLAEDVVNVMQTTIEAMEKLSDFVEGERVELQEDEGIDLVNFNYDTDAKRGGNCVIDLGSYFGDSVGLSGTCSDCHLYAGVTFNVRLVLEDHAVQEFAAWVEGAVSANLDLESFDAEGSWEHEHHVHTFKSDQVPIRIGTKVVFIRAVVPVSLRPEAEATGKLAVKGGAGGGLNVKAGVKFVRSNGELQREMFEELNMEVSAEGFSPVSFSGEAGMRLKLLADINMEIGLGVRVASKDMKLVDMGGPIFAMQVYPETLFEGEYDFESGSGVAEMQSLVGVEGALGLDMKLKVLGSGDLLDGQGVVEPKGIFSQKHPLGRTTLRRLSGTDCDSFCGAGQPCTPPCEAMQCPSPTACDSGSSSGGSGTPAWARVGTTWTGSQAMHPSKSAPCAGDSFLYLTFQAIEVDLYAGPLNGAITFNVATVQGATNVDGGEVFTEIDQQQWKVSLRGGTILPCPAAITPNDGGGVIPDGHQAFLFSRVPNADIDYFASTRGGSAGAVKVGFVCEDSDGLTRFIMEDSMLCVMIDMYEEPASARRLASCQAGPYQWDSSVQRCRADSGTGVFDRFAPTACCTNEDSKARGLSDRVTCEFDADEADKTSGAVLIGAALVAAF